MRALTGIKIFAEAITGRNPHLRISLTLLHDDFRTSINGIELYLDVKFAAIPMQRYALESYLGPDLGTDNTCLHILASTITAVNAIQFVLPREAILSSKMGLS